MWKKVWKCTGIVFLVLVVLTVTGYLAVVGYYQKGFAVNTWVNGVYCTGKTVEEVNTELLFGTEAPVVTIVGRDGTKEEISLVKADYRVDYQNSLQTYIENQNNFLWPKYLMQENRVELLAACTWDEEKLKNLVLETNAVQSEIRDAQTIDVRIWYGENGYEFYDGMQDVFDAEKFAKLVADNFKMGVYTTEIGSCDCFYVAEDNAKQAATRATWQKLEAFLTLALTYDMGAEQIVFDKSVTSKLLLTDATGAFILDAEGSFLWDMELVDAFIEDLAAQYNTCDTICEFHATNGSLVEVPYVTYGTELDTEAEKTYLRDALLNRVEEVHIPTYLQEGYVRGLNDIGDTYIEVDMGNQKLYGYKTGERIVETDIVTGNMKRGWDTPVGVNFVYNKQKNRVLRGQNYATPVDYWMPVKGAIGIHDADWRKEFGGEIYLKNGSHGCVNIPPEVMPTIYEEFEIGTPVIMFY